MQANGFGPPAPARVTRRVWPRTSGIAPILALILAGIAFLRPGFSFATPTAPVLIVNHETRQCSQVIQGDDCSWCEPPAAWEVLSDAAAASCPEGYSRVDAPKMDCRRYETPFCCSGGAHRGNCENMVVDEGAATCGFVENSQGCALPANWQGRPAGVEPRLWACPSDYGWAKEEIACLPAQAGTVEPAEAVPAEDETWRGICFGLSCLSLAALLFGLAAVFPVWYAARQKERRTQPPS